MPCWPAEPPPSTLPMATSLMINVSTLEKEAATSGEWHCFDEKRCPACSYPFLPQ
jgi:hypothetical protein